MPAEILIGPAGSGKTAYLINRILHTAQDDWDEIWVVLPTRVQEDAFRAGLVAQAPVLFNVHFFGIYDLYARLLDIVGQPQRTLRPSAVRRILRAIITHEHAADNLRYYHRIATRPGFVALVEGFIRELKQGVVRHDDFRQLTVAGSDKDRDLAHIYAAYQQFLVKHQLADRDGAGWVSLDALNAEAGLLGGVGLLAVDGFDQFTPLQARLLSAVAHQVRAACVMLNDDEHPLTRLQEADAGVWTVRDLPPQANPRPPATLRGLEAPDPTSEARAVMREVKRVLAQGEASPEQMLIVTREPARYAAPLRSAARAYGVPLVMRYDDAVRDNPAVRSLLALIDLHAADFPRRDLLDLLKSPYFEIPYLSREHIDQLERLSMFHAIVRGAEAWLHYAGQSEDMLDLDAPDEAIPAGDAELAAALAAFFARITPPQQATPAAYVAWLEALLGPDPQDETQADAPTTDHLDFYGAVRAGAAAGTVARDLHALHSLRAALADLLATGALLNAFAPDIAPQAMPWAHFRAELELVLGEAKLGGAANRSRLGRVLATSIYEARGLPHEVVFILGLAEGAFPARQSDDPLYSEHERASFAAQGIELERAADRDRDAALFAQMCALAQRTLILSRPTVDEGGNPWSASVFWDRTLGPDAAVDRLSLGAAPDITEAANPRELAVGLARALNVAPQDIPDAAWRAAAHLQAGDWGWRIWHGRRIERDRERHDLPFDAYGGILRDPALLEVVQRRLGPGRQWSATQFNDLGQCGFRFFSKRLLALDAYEEPEAGLTAIQIGNIYHRVLEMTYAELGVQGLSISPEHLEAALTILDEQAAQVFATAPRDDGFQVDGLWQQRQIDILEKLRALLRLDFSEDSPVNALLSGPRHTYAVEQAFGYEDAPPLEIPGPAGTLLARGYIDRIDTDGESIAVLDYKSGSTPSKKDMQEGRNFQMLLYLLAAQRLAQRDGQAVAGGLFWGIGGNKEGGRITFDDEAVQTAQAILHAAVQAARAGDFANRPRKLTNGKCAHYCEFSRLCRVNRASLRKP